MHQISSIRVTNFKAIRDAEFRFTEYTPIVGYNNAGKSSILEAMSWGVKPTSLPRNGFNNPENPVSVEVQVSGINAQVLAGLTENHRNRVEPFVFDSALRFRRSQSEPGQSAKQIRLEIHDPNGDQEWVLNPTGISAALTALFPEVIFIGAMENAAEDVGKNTSTTTIGKLVKEIVAPVRDNYAPQIAAALSPISTHLSASGANKDQVLRDVDDKIEGYLNAFFPGMSAKTHIPMPEIEDILKKATIEVSEERYGDDLIGDAATLGHGAQRSIQIALINALADIKRGDQPADGRTVLLLLDEPELYLHPQAIAVVKSALKQLSRRGFQVAFTTHNGELVGIEDAVKTLVIRRTPAAGCQPLLRMIDVAEVVAEAQQQADTLFELSNSKEFLFSDKVVLCEGDTELIVFPHVYEKLVGRSLQEDRIGLIRLRGSGNFKKAFDILSAMGLAPCVIGDLDYLFKCAVQHGLVGVDDERLRDVKQIIVELADEGRFEIAQDGCPRKSEICTAEAAYEILAEDPRAIPLIEDLLDGLKQQRFWIWPKGAIERHFGIVEKSNRARRRFVEELRALEGAPQFPEHQTIQGLIDFI